MEIGWRVKNTVKAEFHHKNKISLDYGKMETLQA